MKKVMNKAEIFVDEMIEEILASHRGELTTAAGDLLTCSVLMHTMQKIETMSMNL